MHQYTVSSFYQFLNNLLQFLFLCYVFSSLCVLNFQITLYDADIYFYPLIYAVHLKSYILNIRVKELQAFRGYIFFHHDSSFLLLKISFERLLLHSCPTTLFCCNIEVISEIKILLNCLNHITDLHHSCFSEFVLVEAVKMSANIAGTRMVLAYHTEIYLLQRQYVTQRIFGQLLYQTTWGYSTFLSSLCVLYIFRNICCFNSSQNHVL